jgi:hypothetical protein
MRELLSMTNDEPIATLEPPETHGGALDTEDLARVLGAFRGQPVYSTPTMRYVRASSDGLAPAYVFDEDSGMVYILD